MQGFYTSQLLPKDTYKIRYGDITIGDDAYIGANTVVMPGVVIGEGAVVGANSLVDHNLKPWTIYFGSPARKIGEREKPSEDKKRILESLV